MDDVKDKVKGFMKKVNGPFASSSSGGFKGQGRVLGSSTAAAGDNQSTSSSAPSVHPLVSRATKPSSRSSTDRTTKPPSASGARTSNSFSSSSSTSPSSTVEFSPFETLIASGNRSQANGCSVNIFHCPICSMSFVSESEVTTHVDTCLEQAESKKRNDWPEPYPLDGALAAEDVRNPDDNDLAVRVGVFFSGCPSQGSVEVLMKLLGNIVSEPQNPKFRRVRMTNPKIKEAVADVKGGVELLECVGFKLEEEGEVEGKSEIWATMDVPAEDTILLIKEAISHLEKRQKGGNKPETPSAKVVQKVVEQRVIDRQVRVFFSVPGTAAAKIELPDSFYNLSVDELKREVESRKKKFAESQLLIPKSYKEKQIKAARKKYKAAIIRIQFPDGVVLQGVFLPSEPTTSLYEFVSSSLKDPILEFDLLRSAMQKPHLIDRFPTSRGKPPTLEEEELVPSALVKFRPKETDSNVFTGLRNELLEASEPLTAATSSAFYSLKPPS